MKKILALILIVASLTMSLASCTLIAQLINSKNEEKKVIKIAFMTGPTGMGMAKLIHDNGGLEGNEKYQFINYSDAALAASDLVAGNVDMACIPTNTAATLYNKNGKVKVLALNCLNSLFIMTKTGVEINNLSDLEGKTIYTIQNGTPAVILRHLLAESGVNATVKTTIGEGENEKVITSPNELTPLLIAGKVDIALVPEPVATVAPLNITSQGKDYNYSVAINLTDVWSEISSSPVAMGCIIANKDFADSYRNEINSFLSEYEQSIAFISNQDNLDTAAQYVVDAGVLGAVPAAKKSLKNLSGAIAYKDGAEMKTTLVDFYNAIGLNLVGGKLPDDEFYYEK